MRIFISYSSKDSKEYAKILHNILYERGHDPFFVDHDAYPSEIIWDIISKECLERDLSIFVVTPSSRTSKGQKQEYDLVVANYKRRMALLSKKLEIDEVFKVYPLLKPYRASDFNDSNLEERFEKLSSDLVRLQDKERMIVSESKYKERKFPALSLEGLDSSKVEKSIRILQESFMNETIIPEYFSTVAHDEETTSIKFRSFGFDLRLPREWFLPDQTIVIDLIFMQFGRGIALAERKHLQDSILGRNDIPHIEVDFSPTGLLKAIQQMREFGTEPKVIFVPIKYWTEMHYWKGDTHVEYSYEAPKSKSFLIVDGVKLRVIPPLGDIPTETILLSNGAVKWHVKKHPKYGAIYILLGNDPLYPTRYVELIAGTTMYCEVDPKRAVVLSFSKNKKNEGKHV